MDMDRQLKKNVASLTLLQIGNYLVPLVTLPYLTRMLGVDGFGQFGFVTAFTMYFVLVVDWGFNLSSTRDVAVAREDKLARSTVFWETIASRSFLTVASALLLFVLISLVPKLGEQSKLLWLGILQVLASTLSTAFYYQGIEKMGRMALTNLGIRLLSIPLLFCFVLGKNDIEIAFAIQVGCFLLASLVNLALLMSSREILWSCPSFQGVVGRVFGAFPLFLSTAGASLYNNSNAVVLGFVASEAAVGYFVAGFTLVKAVVGLTGPFGQAVFPRISHLIAVESAETSSFLRRMLLWQFLIGAVLTVSLWIFLPWGVTWFFGNSFQASIEVVAWLSFLPSVICVASVLGMQALVPLGHTRWFAGVFLVCGVLNFLMLLPMGYAWGAAGAAMAVLMTEVTILLGMAMGLKTYEPKTWQLISRMS